MFHLHGFMPPSSFCLQSVYITTDMYEVLRVNIIGSYRVLIPFPLWVVGLPPTCREDVLVPLIPTAQNHLASVRLEGKWEMTQS